MLALASGFNPAHLGKSFRTVLQWPQRFQDVTAMKKVNLFKEIIVVQRQPLMQAINRAEPFAITLSGEVTSEAFEGSDLLVFQGTITPQTPSALQLQAPKSLTELFGSEYQIVEDGERILFKVSGAWQRIIGWNIGNCLYDDTTADGVSHFGDAALEDMGWHMTEFEIGYRDLLEIIEAQCEGTLLCIEQEEPYQFSGMGFIDDIECARKHTFDYCQQRIKQLIAEDDTYAPNTLSDDEHEAAAFFQAL